MKKKHIIINIIILVLIFFGVKNYYYFESTKVDYKSPKIEETEAGEETLTESNRIPKSVSKYDVESNIEYGTIDRKEISKNNSPTILKYRSTNNDFENESEILKTNNETTFHEFDFNNKTITMKNPTKADKWQILVFSWTNVKNLDNGIIEFSIKNDKGVHQVWRSAANNIGYEFYNGTKLVFYDVSRIN